MKFLLIYVPNLRFEKFNDNWSRTTINKVCVCNPKNEDKLDDEFIYIDLESVEKGVLKTKNIIHLKNAPSRAQRILYKNDILFQSVRPYQRNNYLFNQGDDLFQYVASTGYIQIRTTLNPYYLFQLLNTDKINNEVMLRCTGTSYPAINSNDFSNIVLTITNDRDEQNKIAEFFSLIEERINTQIKIIDTLLSEINSIRSLIFNKSSLKWIPLKDIVAEQDIKLKRGKVIPKHKKNLKYIYPVYSSSITNSGLMGYSDSYMFNQELITWSIDGGGNFFYRKKHKFNITNVSGYMILNENLFNYQFIVQSLIWQHEKLKFDYQTKAHPSVVESLYKIPIMDLEEQHKYACLFSNLNEKYELELHILDLLNMQKKYLLKNMFV